MNYLFMPVLTAYHLISLVQVMPQALSYLHIDESTDSLDWGTLLVYTCKSSCAISRYAKEFIWKQSMSNRDVIDTS